MLMWVFTFFYKAIIKCGRILQIKQWTSLCAKTLWTTCNWIYRSIFFILEPGYIATPICMIQAGLTILKEKDNLPNEWVIRLKNSSRSFVQIYCVTKKTATLYLFSVWECCIFVSGTPVYTCNKRIIILFTGRFKLQCV